MVRKPSLGASSAAIVTYLRKHGPQTQLRLSDVLASEPRQKLTRRLNRLRDGGWLECDDAPGLRRRWSVRPSARSLVAAMGKCEALPVAEQSDQPPVEMASRWHAKRYIPGPMTSSDCPRMETTRPGAYDFLEPPSGCALLKRT